MGADQVPIPSFDEIDLQEPEAFIVGLIKGLPCIRITTPIDFSTSMSDKSSGIALRGDP
jgi:hypothetical protein